MIAVREARFPEDLEQIVRIDTSFTSKTIYAADCDDGQIALRLTTPEEPITKRFPLEGLAISDRLWEFAAVALVDDRICGFLGAGYQAWNRRLTIWHLYVDSPQRRRGIARLLLDRHALFG